MVIRYGGEVSLCRKHDMSFFPRSLTRWLVGACSALAVARSETSRLEIGRQVLIIIGSSHFDPLFALGWMESSAECLL